MADPAHRHGGSDAGWYVPVGHGWQRISDGEVGDHGDAAHFMSDPNGRHGAATVATMTAEPRYAPAELTAATAERCLDCAALILTEDKAAHTRFHSILSAHAWAIAVLKNAHIAAHVHDRYEAYGKIDSKRFDSWSADALAEVARDLDGQDEAAPVGR